MVGNDVVNGIANEVRDFLTMRFASGFQEIVDLMADLNKVG